jgi:hypothetical protein
MFQMFGFGGASCPRCEQKNAAGVAYCAGCGLTLGAPRHPALLRENRWIAGPDELAVFFGVRELSGLFVKTLRVPVAARAYILQGDKATEVPQGEYEIEGFFTRLNHLLRDQHAEILVTRTGPLPVQFEFDDLASSEFLPVAVSLGVNIRIESVPAFARHFMTMPGTVTTAELRELLAPAVRQFAAEFIAAQSLRDMAGNPQLREQLDERLQGALKLLLAQYGLAAVQVHTLALRHDLHDDKQSQRIARAELSLAGAERAQAVRTREIELYGRIVESTSRREALARGAGDALAEIEHHLAGKGIERAGQADQWQHVRTLAQLRMQAELEVARQESLQSRQLAQQRFSHQLLLQQIRNKIEQATQIEDAARQRTQLQALRANEQAAQQRMRDIEEQEHAARRQLLVLANTARRRAAEREQEWEDALAQGRRFELEHACAKADALAQHEKLLRTIQADAQQQRHAQDLELQAQERRHALHHADQDAERAHELARIAAMGDLDDTAKLALAGAPNAAALAEFMKTRVHAGMAADQLAALAGVVGASHHPVQQARLGPARACVHGHHARAGDTFCAACGAPLSA